MTIQTRATEVGGNAGQEDGGEASQKVIGGPTFEHTGWLPTSLMRSVISLLIPRYFIAALPSFLPEMGGVLQKYPTTKFGGSTNGYTGGQLAEWEPKPPFMVDTKFSPAKSYSATYTYEMEVLNTGDIGTIPYRIIGIL